MAIELTPAGWSVPDDSAEPVWHDRVGYRTMDGDRLAEADSGLAVVDLFAYLNDSISNVLEAFDAAIDAAADKKASGRYGRVLIDCGWVRGGIESPLILPSSLSDTTIANIGLLYPTGAVGDWLEDVDEVPDDFAYWNKYEKVTSQGKTWSVRKPLIKIQSGNAGFTLEGVYLDGKGNALSRMAAGIRVLGNTSDRKIAHGKLTNVETYGVFIGTDAQNSAQIDLEFLEVKPNGRVTRLDRTSYGVASGGNDMQWLKLTVSNCHSPLQFGESGSTTNLLGCDLFNGSNFDTEGYYHRLVETHGNSCTFIGGRSGNGIWVIYNPNILIGPTKFGVTEGAGETAPPSALQFVATEPDSEVNAFIHHLSETPIDLVTTIPLYGFATEGSGTWAMGTDQLSSLKGHVQASAKGKNFYAQLAPTQTVVTFVGPMTGAVVEIRDDTTDEAVGVGAEGNALQLWAGDAARWEVKSNKHLVPKAADTNLGDASTPVRTAYINAQPATNSAPTLADNEWGIQRVSNTVLRWHFKGSDGTLRTFDIGPFA